MTTRARAPQTLLLRSLDDPAAFGQFYAAYVERITVYYVRRVFDHEIAFDLTAETFALALERRRQFRGSTPQQEQAWLYAIAKNLLKAYLRRGRVERRALDRMGIEPPGLGTEDIEYLHRLAGLEELRERLARALDAVRPEQAAAIRARVLEEREYADIARELGTTQDVVRARVSRGLKTMQRVLGTTLDDVLADT